MDPGYECRPVEGTETGYYNEHHWLEIQAVARFSLTSSLLLLSDYSCMSFSSGKFKCRISLEMRDFAIGLSLGENFLALKEKYCDLRSSTY